MDVEGELSHPLGGVSVEENLPLLTDAADLCQRLNDSDLPVGQSDADQDGSIGDGPFDLCRADSTVGIDRQYCHAFSLSLQLATHVQDGRVFGRYGDDVVAFLAIGFNDALERQIVALGGAACEDKLIGVGSDERC